ncbi:MAG: hypothetical protein ACLFUV_02230 [Methanomassiliicoccales archaeon]
MSKGVPTCNLCKQAAGDIIKGKKIEIERFGICKVCMDELEKLERIYYRDLEDRTGKKMLQVIPWPAFNGFSWPPYSGVITSGWEFHKHEFGLGIGEDFLIAGRRSVQSYETQAIDNMREVQKHLDETEDPTEKVELRKEFRKWQKQLESVEKMMATGERPLYTMPIDFITDMRVERSEDWLNMSFTHKNIKSKFLGGKKEVQEQDFFKFSRYYEEAANLIIRKVQEKGGKVDIRDQK